MKKSVKDIDYPIGTKVYWSDAPEILRGTVLKSLKISVRLTLPDNTIEVVEKRIIGGSILIFPVD